MMRSAICALCLLLLAGCGQRNAAMYSTVAADNADVATVENPYGIAALYTGAAATAPAAQLASPPPGGDAFAYAHAIRLEMERAAIRPRFERARDACLQDATLNCTLVSATISIDENVNYPSSYAQLVVLLPHDRMEGYSDGLLQPVNGEPAGSARLRSRSTQAGNVTNQIADVDRRLTQLTDYRDRLTVLSRRADAKTDDLIRLASELSSAQSNVEEWAGRQRDVSARVAKERMTIYLSERPAFGDSFRPLRVAARGGVAIFSESAGEALTFVIAAIPWLPIFALALFVVARLWRAFWRRRAA